MGVRPPFLILAAVLAIAPVAGIPPKHAEPMFAIPCAMSSILDLCFEPIIESATTAERRDSIPASSAMVIALEICDLITPIEKIDEFSVMGGSPVRISVNAFPIVFTSRLKILTIAAVTITAIRDQGIFLKIIGQMISIARASAPIRTA